MGLKMKIRVFTFKVNIAKDERMSLCRVAAVKHLPVNQYSVVILQFLVLLEYGVQIELETENRSTCSSSRINAHWTILLFIENRKSITNVFSGNILYKNVTHQILNFILVS